MGSYSYCNRCGKLADPDEDVVMLCLPCLKKYDDERAEVERLTADLTKLRSRISQPPDGASAAVDRLTAFLAAPDRVAELEAEVERLRAALTEISTSGGACNCGRDDQDQHADWCDFRPQLLAREALEAEHD